MPELIEHFTLWHWLAVAGGGLLVFAGNGQQLLGSVVRVYKSTFTTETEQSDKSEVENAWFYLLKHARRQSNPDLEQLVLEVWKQLQVEKPEVTVETPDPQ